MVGGKVIETLPCEVDGQPRVWINVRGTAEDSHKTLAVFVERTDAARSVSVGDGLWWQSGRVYWTPKGKPFRDYTLRMFGCSGVARPNPYHEAQDARVSPILGCPTLCTTPGLCRDAMECDAAGGSDDATPSPPRP